MSKNQKPNINSRTTRQVKKPLSGAAMKQLYLLILNSILLLFFYFGTMDLEVQVIPAGVIAPYPIFIGQFVYVAYWLAFAGFLLAYLIYNRGFTRKNITVEMLPDDWSTEKKEDFVSDGKRRFEKSKWMLSVLIPLLVTISIDAIYLFTWPMVQNLFKIS
jgi:hypothetical protein